MDKYMVVCVDLGETELITFTTFEHASNYMKEVKDYYINTYLCEIIERGHEL